MTPPKISRKRGSLTFNTKEPQVENDSDQNLPYTEQDRQVDPNLREESTGLVQSSFVLCEGCVAFFLWKICIFWKNTGMLAALGVI